MHTRALTPKHARKVSRHSKEARRVKRVRRHLRRLLLHNTNARSSATATIIVLWKVCVVLLLLLLEGRRDGVGGGWVGVVGVLLLSWVVR